MEKETAGWGCHRLDVSQQWHEEMLTQMQAPQKGFEALMQKLIVKYGCVLICFFKNIVRFVVLYCYLLTSIHILNIQKCDFLAWLLQNMLWLIDNWLTEEDSSLQVNKFIHSCTKHNIQHQWAPVIPNTLYLQETASCIWVTHQTDPPIKRKVKEYWLHIVQLL